MKQPVFLQDSVFLTDDGWEIQHSRAYCGIGWQLYHEGLNYMAFVWRKRRRIPHVI